MDGLIRRGIEAGAVGRHADALAILESAIAYSPDSSLAYRAAAEQALMLCNNELALDYLHLAIHYCPDDRPARVLLARALVDGKRLDQAMLLVEALAAECPEDDDVAFELARCLYAKGEFSASAHCLEQQLDRHPANPAVLNFLGLLRARDLGDLESGEHLLRRALSASPGYLAAMSNLGWILAERGDLSEAMSLFDRVIECSPDDAETRLMRAQARLKRGLFKDGWRDFSARHQSPLAIRRANILPTMPESHLPSEGNRLLVLSEQGIGDQIMFASCIPDLLAQGYQVTLECHRQLRGIFGRSFRACVVTQEIAPGESESLRSKHDFQLFLGDLPGRFRNSLEDFPHRAGFLSADPEKTRKWRAKLEAQGPGPYVGISWRGGTRATRRQLRSVEPGEWRPIIDLPITLVSLQYGDCADDLSAFSRLGAELHHWPEAIEDYEETAALVSALDVVVSVCTAAVHLTGALGKVAHVLTPAQPEWRYLDKGNTLPWYPSVVLHRQRSAGQWDGVMQSVAARLAASW